MIGARDFLVVGVRNASVWAVVGFCVLRSLEVLLFERPLFLTTVAVAISSLMFAVVVYLKSLGNSFFRWNSSHTLAFSALAWFVVSVIAQLAFTPAVVDQNGVDSHVYLVKVTIAMFIWFFAGAGSSFSEGLRGGELYVLLLVGLFLLVLKATNFGFFIPYDSLSGYVDSHEMNHLLLSEYMLIVCFFGYAVATPAVRVFLFAVISYILFAGGGRASFFIGVLSLVGYEFLFRYWRLGFLLAGLALALAVVGGFVVGADSAVIARMLVTEGVGADASFGGRFEQFLVGAGGFWHQALWGDISYFVVRLGGVGNYIHNFLSAWQFYGALGFLLYAALAVKAVNSMLIRSRMESIGWLDRVFSGLLIYSIVSVLLVKAVVFSTFWLTIGYWIFRSANFRTAEGGALARW